MGILAHVLSGFWPKISSTSLDEWPEKLEEQYKITRILSSLTQIINSLTSYFNREPLVRLRPIAYAILTSGPI